MGQVSPILGDVCGSGARSWAGCVVEMHPGALARGPRRQGAPGPSWKERAGGRSHTLPCMDTHPVLSLGGRTPVPDPLHCLGLNTESMRGNDHIHL